VNRRQPDIGVAPDFHQRGSRAERALPFAIRAGCDTPFVEPANAAKFGDGTRHSAVAVGGPAVSLLVGVETLGPRVASPRAFLAGQEGPGQDRVACDFEPVVPRGRQVEGSYVFPSHSPVKTQRPISISAFLVVHGLFP